LALLDDGGRQAGAATAVPIAEPALPPLPTVAEQPSPSPQEETRAQVLAALEGCRTMLAAERFEDASRAAQNGLALQDGDPDLSSCKRDADEAQRSLSAYQEGVKALNENKLEDAYFLFAGIPDGSSLRDKPEVRQTMQRIALGRLSEARAQLRSKPEETRKLAHSVLDMYGLTENMRADAQHLLVVSGRALSGAAPRANRQAAASASQSAPPPASSEGGDTESPSKVARNCLARGDQRCAVRALEGRTENSQELALLIETYRALGETKKAVRHMESFVSKYPTARQAPQYRQFIAKHDD
jgi:hypothetical protein